MNRKAQFQPVDPKLAALGVPVNPNPSTKKESLLNRMWNRLLEIFIW